jgi:hypothetical protein
MKRSGLLPMSILLLTGQLPAVAGFLPKNNQQIFLS